MTRSSLPHALLRPLLAATLAAVVACRVGAASPATSVVAIERTRVADLVLLDSGFNAGLRQGMLCRVSRSGQEVAEVLIVELRPASSAALIVHIAPRQAIRAGDAIRVKVLKS